MLPIHYDLLLNALVSFISAGVNLYYVMKHSNGKKGIRLVSCVIMIYFTIIQLAAGVGWMEYHDFGVEYLRPWMPVLYLIPVFDVIVDFKKKKPPEEEANNPWQSTGRP